MHYTLSILLLALTIFQGCKTCPTSKVIADGLTAHMVKQLECTDRKAIHAELMDMCEEHDLCSKDRIIPIDAIPTGSWSEAALSCLFITGAAENLAITTVKKVVKDEIVSVPKWKLWGCKRGVMDPAGLEKMCAKL